MRLSTGRLSVFNVAALYAGAVIGAGFASGQELLQFFIVFGQDGLLGVALAGALFCYLGGLVMFLSVSSGAGSYRDLYRMLLSRAPGRVMDILSLAMLPGGILVMLAGGGAVFSEQMGLSRLFGTVLTALIICAVISMGIQGVIAANAVLVPVKVGAIVLICLLALVFYQPSPGSRAVIEPLYGSRINWGWSALLYVSYNMVVPAAVLSSLGRSVPLRAGVLGGMLGGSVLGALALLMVYTGLCFYPGITGYEVPLLFVAGSLGPAVKAVVGALIWVAILTTAIADTHGFASRLSCSKSGYRAAGVGAVLICLPLSSLKFSLLVKVLYPLFGYAGLILLAALLIVPPVKYIRRKLT